MNNSPSTHFHHVTVLQIMSLWLSSKGFINPFSGRRPKSREVKSPVGSHKANEMEDFCWNRSEPWAARKRPNRGAHSPAQGSGQAWLTPSPHLSATVDKRQLARDKAANKEIHAAEIKTPDFWEGTGGAVCPVGPL